MGTEILKTLFSIEFTISNIENKKQFRAFCEHLPKGSKVEEIYSGRFRLTLPEKIGIKAAKELKDKVQRYYT